VTSDARADLMSDRLGRLGVPHQVLRTDQQAAGGHLLANAGRKGAVTVVTDAWRLPGRIPLGGPEATAAERDEVAAAGGLLVLATERRVSRAADSRLCDVAAADGDPGECVFMMARGDRLADSFRWWPAALAGDVPVSSSMVNWAVASGQRLLAGVRLDQLKRDLAWASVFEELREQMSRTRAEMLSLDGVSELMLGYLREVVDGYLAGWAAGDSDPEALEQAFRQLLGEYAAAIALPGGGPGGRAGGPGRQELAASAHAVAERAWARRGTELGPDIWLELQRRVLVSVLDRNWREYMQALEEIREHAPLQGLGRRDPLAAYQASAREEFALLEDAVKEESIGSCLNLIVEVQENPQPAGAEPEGAPPAIGPPGT
jgi:preprotein translocase subunit SecA